MTSFESSDVYLTSALSSLFIPYDESYVREGRVIFVWNRNAERAQEMAEKYYQKQLQVNARAYADEIRGLKTILHQPVSQLISAPKPRRVISASGRY